MEFNFKKTPLKIISKALDTVSEQPVDMDFILPDYCPDIEKILRCKMSPKIYNRNISGGQLQVDGTTVVTVLYVTSQNKIRACEQNLPFSGTFQVSDSPENSVIETWAKPEYVNCRALSPRRLAVHGAFSLYGKVLCKSETELCSPNETENLECKTKNIKAATVTALCQDIFSAGDEISISNKPPIEVIIDSNVKANITDYRIIPDKLMVNGELNVKLLYLSDVEKGELQQIDYIIPFSQVVDCTGLTEDLTVSPELNLLSYDVRLKSDLLAETPVADVDAKLSITVFGYNSMEVPIITDAYSTEFVTDINSEIISTTSDIEIIKDTFMQKEEISLEGTNISSIIDLSNEYCTLSPIISEDGLILNSKLNICILGNDSENNPVYLERTIEFPKPLNFEKPFNNVEKFNSSIVSISYRIGDNNNLELRIEVRYSLTLTNIEKNSAIVKAFADEDNKIQKDNCALTLYFAEKGESLWDIAKEYNTKQQSIYDENSLEQDILDSAKMLLIPTV